MMRKSLRQFIHTNVAWLSVLAVWFAGQAEAWAAAVPNDPYYSRQHHLRQIKADKAWDAVTGNTQIRIAVLDSGVDLNHPDLKPNIVPGINLLDRSKPPMDDNGHGTQVAGILAARGNNGTGVTGVLWNARIMPIKVLDSKGNADDVKILADGIREAVHRGAKVVLMSVSVLYPSHELESAVRYAESRGVVLVAAAGNEGSRVSYPAAYPTVIAVGAVDGNNVPLWQSNSGPEVNLVAPGRDVYTTIRGGQYGTMSGTSAAAPQVAAAAAMILARNPDMTPLEVRQQLYHTARDLGQRGWDRQTGHGLLDVAGAVNTLLPADTFEPNNSRQTAVPFPIESQVRAALSSEDRVDWYYTDVPYNGRLTFSVTTTSKSVAAISATFYVEGRAPIHHYLGNGDVVAVPASGGRVYMQLVRGGDVGSFQYVLTSEFAVDADQYEPNNMRQSARALPSGNRISVEGTFHNYGDVDWYTYQVRSPGKLRVTVSPDTLRMDPVLYVENQEGRGATVDRGTAKNPAEEINLDVKEGKYYIGVKEYWNNAVNGKYTLQIEFVPERKDSNEPNDTHLYATRLGAGGLMTGTIPSRTDADWFQFTLDEDAIVTVKAPHVPVSHGMRLELYQSGSLSRPLYTETRVAQLSAGGRPVLSTRLSAGTYYIRLTSTVSFERDEYRLTLTVEPPETNTRVPGRPIVLGPPLIDLEPGSGGQLPALPLATRLVLAIQEQDVTLLAPSVGQGESWLLNSVLSALRGGVVEQAAYGIHSPFVTKGRMDAVAARVKRLLPLPFRTADFWDMSRPDAPPAAVQRTGGFALPAWREERWTLWMEIPDWLRHSFRL